MKLIFSKGPALSIRLLLAISFAVGLIVVDKHYFPFLKLRSHLDTLISPFYYVVNGPSEVLDDLSSLATRKNELVKQNKALQAQLLEKQNDLLLLEHLKRENDRLRKLLGSPLRDDEFKMVTQVISTESGQYSNQLVIDKGTHNGVYVGQPIVDEKGIVGQVYAVAKNTSRVILLCDSQHGLPVQVVRNDTRVVAIGNGCNEDLMLDFLPNNVDIRVGDQLVTSGLDGRFSEGYPVGIVSSIYKDTQRGRIVIKATPTAGLKHLRYLLLLWSEERQASPEPEQQAENE